MTDKSLPPSDDRSEKISDAEALFRDLSNPKPRVKPKPKPVVDPSSIGQYEVEALPTPAPSKSPSSTSPPKTSKKSAAPPLESHSPFGDPLSSNPFDDPWGVEHRPAARKTTATSTSASTSPTRSSSKISTSTPRPSTKTKEKEKELSPSQAVEEVWTRSAEWGGTIAGMVIESILTVGLVYFLLSIEEYGWAFLGLTLGGFFFVFLSYPLMITLERPVRMTPEQAVKDYFDSLSHHFPHYTRMWLLLSTAGKVSPSFASFDGFRRYWRDNLAKIRKGRVSSWTPLKFQVQDFRSEKSAGKTVIDASFTVRVLVRGRQGEGAIDSFRVDTRLVKGPDRMWYVNKGTLR